MSRAHRGKQLDWSKPFKLIDSKAIFQDLDTDANEMVININSKVEPPPGAVTKKQQIIVPKIQIVKRITEPKKFAKVQPNYIRLREELNLPKLQSYELNEVDHVFLQGQANKFKFNGRVILTPEFLSKAFIQLQKKAGKDPVFPKNKNWLTSYMQRQYKQLTAMPNYEQFTQVFYNYWKNRREELKFPMLRSLWYPGPNEVTHLLAFKQREKQKRNMRRNNRIQQDDIAQQLQEQTFLATKIVQRIKLREELKFKQLQIQLSNFHNDCKQFFGTANATFFGQVDYESRNKDKQKLKKFQIDLQNIKKQQSVEQMQAETSANAISFNQKQSIAQFLSTVVNIVDSSKLNYDLYFNQKVPQKVVPAPTPLPEPQPQDEVHDYMKIKLYRDQNTIYRTFKQLDDDTAQSYIKSPKDIFDFRSKQLQLYYYGSDDETDAKDLKKTISTNFKKFQQNKIGDL